MADMIVGRGVNMVTTEGHWDRGSTSVRQPPPVPLEPL